MNVKIVLLVSLILAAAPMVFSQSALTVSAVENETSINLTANDTIIEVNTLLHGGAYVRKLQFEISLEKHIQQAGEVISAIQQLNASINVTQLQAILDELKLLQPQVEDLPINGTTSIIVQQFVGLKDEAVRLVQQFRLEARSLLNGTEVSMIRSQIMNMSFSGLSNKTQAFANAVRAYNSGLVQGYMHKLGTTNNTLVQQVLSGNLTKSQISNAVRHAYGTLNNTQQDEFLNETEEEDSQNLQNITAHINAFIANYTNIKAEHLDKMLSALNNSNASAAAIVRNMIQEGLTSNTNLKNLVQQHTGNAGNGGNNQ